MATNLGIDTDLLKQALELGKLKTKKETVNQALREFIQRRKMEDVISAFGTIEYSSDYEYDQLRTRP
ncbi:MAG: type II toxin-antitoxin system VapB family antitoxin [Bacteroidetes bacterium]|nr:type II toxin-antitoxin system VapB family antitoxin [Bacteroidota bacterium]